MLPEPLAVTLKVTTVLDDLGVKYLIGGSLASTLYGLVRTTQDSDIVADLQADFVQPFVRALEGEFFMDPEIIAEAVRGKTSFNIIHRETMFKVDVFIPAPSAFIDSQFARLRAQAISEDPALRANFASPEDTILSKLSWYRMGGEVSERAASAPRGF